MKWSYSSQRQQYSDRRRKSTIVIITNTLFYANLLFPERNMIMDLRFLRHTGIFNIFVHVFFFQFEDKKYNLHWITKKICKTKP